MTNLLSEVDYPLQQHLSSPPRRSEEYKHRKEAIKFGNHPLLLSHHRRSIVNERGQSRSRWSQPHKFYVVHLWSNYRFDAFGFFSNTRFQPHYYLYI